MRPVSRQALPCTAPNQKRIGDDSNDVVARWMACSATVVMSSTLPSAPSAIISAREAIMA